MMAEGEWAFLVFVGVRLPGSRKLGWHCGGSLIHPSFILTAAHCVSRGNRKFAVLAGHSRLPDDGDPAWNEAVDVTSFTIHPDYETQGHYYDAAVLKLARPLQENGVDIARSALNHNSSCPHPDTHQQCSVAGWGSTSYNGTVSKTARVVNLTVVSNEQCSDTYGDITPSKICAGEQQGQKDSCAGDSGGPLVCTCNGEKLVVGVVSYGDQCALPGKPGVYSRVSSFWQWAEAQLNTAT